MGEVLEALAGFVPGMHYSVVAEGEAKVWVNPERQEEPIDNSRLRTELKSELQYPLAEGRKQRVCWVSKGNLY